MLVSFKQAAHGLQLDHAHVWTLSNWEDRDYHRDVVLRDWDL